MTDKTRQAKSYTPEFRESAVQLAIESEKSVSVVAMSRKGNCRDTQFIIPMNVIPI